MSAVRKMNIEVKNPARPRKGKLNIKALCADTAKRYPKIMAKLAE